MNIQTQIRAAIQAAQSGDLDGAAELCSAALKSAPENPDALQIFGLVRKQQGRLDDARRYMARSLAINPNQPHVLNNLGNVLSALGEPGQAADCYEKAVAMASDYVDAWLNLSAERLTMDDPDAAFAAAGKALALQPGSARAHKLKGRALLMQGEPEKALESLEAAVASEDADAEAHHNLGIAFRELGRPDDAAASLRRALTLRPDAPETHYVLGHALFDSGNSEGAIAHYQEAIRLRPGFIEAHKTLNNILWQLSRGDEYLTSFEGAIERVPESPDLYLELSNRLLLKGDSGEAAEVMQAAIRRCGDSDARLWHALARAEASLGHADKATAGFDRAVRLAPANPDIRADFARLLIISQAYDDALRQVEEAERLTPDDQQIVCYKWLCWRLTGDERAAWLYDYQHLVRDFLIPVPPGYADINEFNAALVEALAPLHLTETHPSDQTLVGGTQTQGPLFAHRNVPEIMEVRRSLEKSIAQYIDELPDDPAHPLMSRRSKAFRFSGSWSVKLRSQGYHVNHVHPAGWISSCYYVSLPEAVQRDREGWIKFGETNMKLGEKEETGRMIKPREGLLALFPSYMYHGTVPFDSNEPRITIAFDVVPD